MGLFRVPGQHAQGGVLLWSEDRSAVLRNSCKGSPRVRYVATIVVFQFLRSFGRIVEYIQARQVPVSCAKYFYASDLVFLPVPRGIGCFHSVRRHGGRAGLDGANTVAYDCSAQVLVKSSHAKQLQGMFWRPVWGLPEASVHEVSLM